MIIGHSRNPPPSEQVANNMLLNKNCNRKLKIPVPCFCLQLLELRHLAEVVDNIAAADNSHSHKKVVVADRGHSMTADRVHSIGALSDQS